MTGKGISEGKQRFLIYWNNFFFKFRRIQNKTNSTHENGKPTKILTFRDSRAVTMMFDYRARIENQLVYKVNWWQRLMKMKRNNSNKCQQTRNIFWNWYWNGIMLVVNTNYSMKFILKLSLTNKWNWFDKNRPNHLLWDKKSLNLRNALKKETTQITIQSDLSRTSHPNTAAFCRWTVWI